MMVRNENPVILGVEVIRDIIAGECRRLALPIIPTPERRWNFEQRDGAWFYCDGNHHRSEGCDWSALRCQYGNVGDRLWVQEECVIWAPIDSLTQIFYRATDSARVADVILDDYLLQNIPWRPAHLMQRREARLILELTSRQVDAPKGVADDESGRPVWTFDFNRIEEA